MKLVLSVLLIILLSFLIYGRNKVRGVENKVDNNSLIIPGNGEAESVNIKKMVAAEIEQAHKKMLEEQSIPKTVKTQNVKIKKAGTIEQSVIALPGILYTFSSAGIKVVILAFASIIAALVIVLRRKKSSKIFRTRQALKNNIKLLREEKIFIKQNNKLSGIRFKLKNSPTLYGHSKEGLLKAAKSLNISQGEILLAAKIKSHELDKTWLTKQ